MSRRTNIVFFLLLACGALPWPALAQTPVSDSHAQAHAEAVALARSNQIEEALRIIEELREAAPEDANLLYDETVILGWADRDSDVIRNAEEIDPETAPYYAIASVAKAFRNSEDYDSAVRWYEAGLKQDPLNLDARVGVSLSLTDAGQYRAAQEILDAAPAEQRDATDLRLANAYIYERQGELVVALGHYQRILEKDPDNLDALRQKIILLRSILLPGEALELARRQPGVLNEREMANLEADVAALQIRRGTAASYPSSRHFEGIDKAIANLDALLARNDLDPDIARRLRYDRIVALTDRYRTAEAVEEYESMEEDIADTPAYVLSTVGKAYLYERQPVTARTYLETAHDRQPEDLEIKFRLFFVYADLQLHNRALELAESILEDLPATNQVPGSNVSKGSSTYLRAQIILGLAHAFSDQLEVSQRHFEDLLADLPNNTDIRQELASVYRWRGWTDRSLAEYSQVLAVEPELLSARIGYVHSLIDGNAFIDADHEIRKLAAEHSYEPAVQALQKRWRIHNQQIVGVDTSFGKSTGNTFGQDQYVIDAYWYSQPIAYKYRAFVKTHDDFAEFPEGSARRKRAAAGVEYKYKRWLVSGGLSLERDFDRPGLRALVQYRFDDYLDFGVRVETESDAMPLRGYRVGVSSDIIGLEASYSRNHASRYGASLTLKDNSDGNTGAALYVGGERRLLNLPSYKLAFLGSFYAEQNKLQDVFYFSPSSAYSLGAGLRNDWIQFRRYDFALFHSLTGRLELFDQSGFDAATNWALEYRFQAELNARWSTYVGLVRNSNVYDGNREKAVYVHAGFGGRF